jgi:EAL domain-containing protein (putative c-di-GMP-specific phosphodiesterase class I)/sensor domain CHASE-containing protein
VGARPVTRLTKFGSKVTAGSAQFPLIGNGARRTVAASAAHGILIAAFLSIFCAPARAADVAVDSLDTQPAVLALKDLRHAWLDQLNELIASVRALAVADDTYEFMNRPNIPYVDAHYAPEYLAAERIDTVLIIDLHGKPLFWRRLNQGENRGFPDARRFLAELPPLQAPGVAGEPSLAGPATLVHGPKLLVAMPIYASSGSGAARGWFIATRALDAYQWHRFEELAHVRVQLLDPVESQSTGDIGAALQEPLVPIVRVEDKHIRGFMAVSDVQGKPFRVFSISLARQEAAVVAASFLARSVPLLILTAIVASLALVATGFTRRRGVKVVWLNAPDNDDGARPSNAKYFGPKNLAVTPRGTAFIATQTRDPLRARLAASNAVFRYQPQIDLRTGRIAGVEAVLCIPGMREHRPAIELAAEIEAAGHGLALVERRLHDACRERRAWLRTVGHEFPIGVPVPQRTLLSAAFLPLVQGILAEHGLAASLLELEVDEAALGPSAAALRSVTLVRDAGISIAIDGFNAAHSNLRLLSILPISKLRVDPYLLLRISDGPSEALLFDGIIGAARGLGIMVCATGIASQELLSTVLRHGRPLAQGAALSPLLDGEDFLQLLRADSADAGTSRPMAFGIERLPQEST